VNLKRWIGMISITCGLAIGVAGLAVDAATSYVGDEMSISDGLMVYRKVGSRDGSGFVGIGMTDPKEYLLPTTPNLGIAGDMRIHGSLSQGEIFGVTPTTIDWKKGNNQQFLAAQYQSEFIFSPPQGTSILTLNVRYNNSAGYLAFKWPSNVKWPLGEKPIMSTANITAADHSDTIFFFYDANRQVYYGVRSYGNK
jgi:hypothetical protein